MHDELEPVTEEGAIEPNGAVPSSEMERLRQIREQIGERTTAFFPIPNYQNKLWGKYHLIGYAHIRRMAERADNATKRGIQNAQLLSAADMIIAACDGLYFLADGQDSENEDNFVPLGFAYDERCAQYFGFEARTARQTILGVFKNELALLDHANDLTEWFQGRMPDADEDFLGESAAQQPSS